MSKKYQDGEICIRAARREDMTAVSSMIQELADFEKMPDGPQMSVKELEHDGFEKEPPAFQCMVAERRDAVTGAGPVVGYALYFPIYSTWQGRSVMLEDLYVQPSERRRGVGRRLFEAIAQEASSSGCSRVDFHVLEWNDARSFYEGVGAVNLTALENWCYYRLSGDALRRAAANALVAERAPTQ